MPVPSSLSIVLFDGVCNLCNATVIFFIRRDSRQKLVFASLQSETGQKYLREFQLSADTFNTFIFVEGDQWFSRSTGAIRAVSRLGGVWTMASVLLLIPRVLRDTLYDWVARNRYRWFGKKEQCLLPTPELQSRFLP